MFTVVLAEKKHISSIEKYELFLKPFADKKHTKLIEWNREGKTWKDCIPDLEETIAHHKNWRAIVLCGQDALSQKNPFDIVECELPPRPEGGDDGEDEPDYEVLREYYQRVREIKFKAYEEAIKNPLTRLMTYLCEQPLATGGINHGLVIAAGREKLAQQGFEGADFEAQERRLQQRQLEYEEYLAEAKKKEELRGQIIGDEVVDIILPKQVICIALRTRRVQEHDLKEQWNPHVNHQYNRFYDWNLYFDKMRYLVFDILPKNNKRYELDYIHFLSTTLLLANNELPPDALQPNVVYVLDCVSDDKALQKMLLEYDAKLSLTDEMLERSIADWQNIRKDSLTDSEAERIFHTRVTVPVSTNADFDRTDLYATSEGIGLASDCPGDETLKWEQEYNDSVFALGRFIKQPRRALQKSVDILHALSEMSTDQCRRLDNFQMEDIAEYVYDEEMDMIDTPTRSIYKVDRYYRQMEDADKEVQAKLAKRMTKKRTIVLGACAMAVYLIGFLPMIIGSLRNGDAGPALLLLVVSLLLFAGVAVVCLLFLRHDLVKLIKKFNETMKSIEDDIDDSMTQFSRYLSHACSVMRGYWVLNFCNEADDPGIRVIRLTRKHQQDIRRQRAQLRETFKDVMDIDGKNPELLTQEPYMFDFSKTKDYIYPMPYREDLKRNVKYIQSGYEVEAPVSFIKEIGVRLEELYD